MPTEEQRKRASAHGRFCGMRGFGPDRCPWKPSSDSAADRVLAHAWLRGYRQWVPLVVDYEG